MILINYTKNNELVRNIIYRNSSIRDLLTFSPLKLIKPEIKVFFSKDFCSNHDHQVIFNFHQSLMKKIKFRNIHIKEIKSKEEEIFSYEIFQKYGIQFLNIKVIDNFLKDKGKGQKIYFLADCDQGRKIFNFFKQNGLNIELIFKARTKIDSKIIRSFFNINIQRAFKITLYNKLFPGSKFVFNQSFNKFEKLFKLLPNARFYRKNFPSHETDKKNVDVYQDDFLGYDFIVYRELIEQYISNNIEAFKKLKADLDKNIKDGSVFITCTNTTPVEIAKNIILGERVKVFFYFDGAGIIDKRILSLYKFTIPQSPKIKKLFWSKAQYEESKILNGKVVGCLGFGKVKPLKDIKKRKIVLLSLTSSSFTNSLPLIQKSIFEMLDFLKDVSKAAKENNLKVYVKIHPSDYENKEIYQEKLNKFNNVYFLPATKKIPHSNILINLSYDTTMSISTTYLIPYQIIFNPFNRPNLSTYFETSDKLNNIFFVDSYKSLSDRMSEIVQSGNNYTPINLEYILENFCENYDSTVVQLSEEIKN